MDLLNALPVLVQLFLMGTIFVVLPLCLLAVYARKIREVVQERGCVVPTVVVLVLATLAVTLYFTGGRIWPWVVKNWEPLLGYAAVVVLPTVFVSVTARGSYDASRKIVAAVFFGLLALLSLLFWTLGGTIPLLVTELLVGLPVWFVFHLGKAVFEVKPVVYLTSTLIALVAGLVANHYQIELLSLGGETTKPIVDRLKADRQKAAAGEQTGGDVSEDAADTKVEPRPPQGEEVLGAPKLPDPIVFGGAYVKFDGPEGAKRKELFDAMLPRTKSLLTELIDRVEKIDKRFATLRDYENRGILSKKGEGSGDGSKFADPVWWNEIKPWTWRVPMETYWYTVAPKSDTDTSYQDFLHRVLRTLAVIEVDYAAGKVSGDSLNRVQRMHDFAARELGFPSMNGVLTNGRNCPTGVVSLESLEFKMDVLIRECEAFEKSKKR